MGKLKKPKSLAVKSQVTKAKPSKDQSTAKLDTKQSKKKGSNFALKLSNPVFSGIKKTISKKDKQQKKQTKIREKLEQTKAAFQEEKNKKKRAKTAVVGDLKPLLDSLPSLDELVTLKSSRTGIASIDRRLPKEPKTRKARKQKSIHEKTEKMLDRFDHVQKIWRDPEFKKDPRKLIAEKIRARRLANEMET